MKKWLCFFYSLIFFCSFAHAAKVNTLYQTEVPVASQADSDRQAAESTALKQVILKLVGDSELIKNEVIQESLKNAENFIQEFSYTEKDGAEDVTLLRVKFSERDVNRLLSRAGVAYWGENRPLIMVWAALKDKAGQVEIISNESQNEWINTIKEQGTAVGLPFIFPVMDVSDVNQIAASDVTTPVLPVIKEASKRYAPDAVLIGSITAADARYISQWILMAGSKQWNWTISGASLHEVAMAISYQISQTLSKQYVAKTEVSVPQTWVKLEVSNLTETDDLAHVLQYLKQISQVQQVQLSEVEGEVANMTVLVKGSVDKFLENAAIGRRLVFKAESEDEKFTYEWVH